MWQEKNDQLCRAYKFKDFAQAISFMMQVAIYAEKSDHHPWWSNVYDLVEVRLSTHDAGNKVTEKDHALAEVMDMVYKQLA